LAKIYAHKKWKLFHGVEGRNYHARISTPQHRQFSTEKKQSVDDVDGMKTAPRVKHIFFIVPLSDLLKVVYYVF